MVLIAASIIGFSIGVPALFITGNSLLTSLKVIGSILWLPSLVNKLFMEKMPKDKMNAFQNVKLQGTRYEYPSHLREYSGLYGALFLIASISSGLGIAFS